MQIIFEVNILIQQNNHLSLITSNSYKDIIINSFQLRIGSFWSFDYNWSMSSVFPRLTLVFVYIIELPSLFLLHLLNRHQTILSSKYFQFQQQQPLLWLKILSKQCLDFIVTVLVICTLRPEAIYRFGIDHIAGDWSIWGNQQWSYCKASKYYCLLLRNQSCILYN